MKSLYLLILFCAVGLASLSAQPEVYPWSNISGIRLDGELMELNSSFCVFGTDWSDAQKSAKETGRYQYHRRGSIQLVSLSLDRFIFNQSVEDLGAGRANVRIQFHAELDTAIIGTFWALDLPSSKYSPSTLRLISPARTENKREIPESPGKILHGTAGGMEIRGPARNLEIIFNEPTEIIVREAGSEDNGRIEVYFALMSGRLNKGDSGYQSIDVKALGIPDLSPVVLTIDTSVQGKPFKGFGGNFRLQNPGVDEKVIDYCLEHMDVRWGRVEMPWWFWHQDEDDDPLARAESGDLHPRVKAAMEIAHRLHQLGMPVILSDWSAPGWAIQGSMTFGPQPGGLRGNPLDRTKLPQIYRSIADYLQFVKDHYGFEFAMFSFNESDLGIYVRQTPEEHADFIKGLGAYLESRGLKTKLLLGDTADANGWPFIQAAMDDESTHPYIGAISFHSWRGYTDKNLWQWARAAEKMKLPLLVGEGSMDAGAHRYPDIFSEPTYAMEEANLYVRILKICQPESILQWQLTADYSPMTGGGVFGNIHAPLMPTQRFWNFKQIADMPQGLYAMPVETDRQNVVCAAMGDNDIGTYVIHMVNNGASRLVTLRGLPESTRRISLFVTNETRQMTQRRLWVRNGEAFFFAESNSFISLLAERGSPNRFF
jgi:hypothetical protein